MAKGAAAVAVKVQKKKSVTRTIFKTRPQGSYTAKKAERGQGLKFKLETFTTVSQFQPGTRIKYGPNPKQPQSKSFKRYAGYQKAKTVGEAIKFGAKKADLFWELERGDYKILGGARSESEEIAAIGRAAFEKTKSILAAGSGPNGCPVKLNDPRAAERLAIEEKWRADRLKRVEKRAKALHLKVENSDEIEGESADIRLQRRVAEAIAKQMLESKKKITDADVSEVLSHWGFSENTSRLNVMPEGQKYVYSDTVGAIRARSFGFGSTPVTKRYPAMAKVLCQWLADNKPGIGVKFCCTAINLNCNYAGRRHRDGNNEGPSVIRAFGKYKGGRLRYFQKDKKKDQRPALDTLNMKDSVMLDLSKKTMVFDGNRAHEVEPFTGERYSAVFFTARGWNKGKAKDVKFLKDQCGFPFPTSADLSKLKKAAENH